MRLSDGGHVTAVETSPQAIAYVKLIGSSDADEETVMLKEG